MPNTKYIRAWVALVVLLSCVGCNDKLNTENKQQDGNIVRYAKGLQIIPSENYTKIVVKNPWPGAAQQYTYIVTKKNTQLPDSLANYTRINTPLKRIIATSTTHIPSIESLKKLDVLVGFPGTNYISSVAARQKIAQGKIKDVGQNEQLNTELVMSLQPDALIGFSIDNDNKTMAALQQFGIPVLYNGDWMEQTPLGKAEWILFFGALLDHLPEAQKHYKIIEKNYLRYANLAQKVTHQPTILAGNMYQNIWYLPQGESWAARFFEDAKGQYLWKNTKGTGSAALSFESVFEKAQKADVWIEPGSFATLQQLCKHYHFAKELKAVQSKKVFSFSAKKGATGGVVFCELAPNRPDLVLRDLLVILHPHLFQNKQLHFYTQLK